MDRGDAAWIYLHHWQGIVPKLSRPGMLGDLPPPNHTMQGCSAAPTIQTLMARVAPTSSDTNLTYPRVEFMSKDRNGVKNSPKPRKPAQTRK